MQIALLIALLTMAQIALLIALLTMATYALFARRLSSTIITAPVIFLGLGLLIHFSGVVPPAIVCGCQPY